MTDLQQEQRYRSAICRIGRSANNPAMMIVGAGFLVSDRHIFTCAHVINAALGESASSQPHPSEVIRVEFCEQLSGQWLPAKVVYWLPMNGSQQREDIAVLELLQPLGAEYSLELPAIAPQRNNPCKAYGFSRNHENGVWSYGIIQDQLLGPSGWGQIAKRTRDAGTGYAIEKGFSGTLLWDEQEQRVAGMVVAAESRPLEVNTAFVIPNPVLLGVLRSLELGVLLQPHAGAIAPSLQAAYGFCKPKLLRAPDDGEDLQHLLEKLEEIEAQEPGAIGKFVAHLVEDNRITDTKLKLDLTAWASPLCPNFAEFRQEAASRLNVQPAESPANSTKSAVLVILECLASKPNYFRARIIAVPNCAEYEPKTGKGAFNLLADDTVRECSLEDLPELLSPCLELANCRLSAPTVEIFLPLQSLNTIVETWTVGDELFGDTDRLGNQHCVMLRSYERALRPAKIAWHDRWEKLEREGDSHALLHFLLCNGKNLDGLKVDLTCGDVLGLGLTHPPNVMKGGPLSYVFSNGIPVALWVRQDLPNRDCAQEFKALLDCELKNLPQAVQRQRKAAYRSGVDPQASLEHTQLGHHLALLWDNPKLPPPDPTLNLLQMS